MKPNKLSIAITGGIGSGKSEVCRLLNEQNIPVISADKLGHLALADHDVKEQLIEEFGEQILINGEIDRNLLGNIVFKDELKTLMLNKIIHPVIIRMLQKEMSDQKTELTAYEIPLLFEVGLEKLFDIIIMIWASEKVRRDRLLKRSGMSELRITEIIAQQYSQVDAKARSHYIIENSGSMKELEKALKEVLKEIKNEMEEQK